MNAKQFLKQHEEATRRALRYKHEYEAEQEMIDNVRSTLGGDGMPHGSGVSRKVEDQAIRLAEKALRWKTAELEAIQVRQQVFDVIHDIGGVESEILFERYINLRKWEAICVIVHMSWRQTHRLHAKALQMVAEKMALNGIYEKIYD